MSDKDVETAKAAIEQARQLNIPVVLNLNLSQAEWKKVWGDAGELPRPK